MFEPLTPSLRTKTTHGKTQAKVSLSARTKTHRKTTHSPLHGRETWGSGSLAITEPLTRTCSMDIKFGRNELAEMFWDAAEDIERNYHNDYGKKLLTTEQQEASELLTKIAKALYLQPSEEN